MIASFVIFTSKAFIAIGSKLKDYIECLLKQKIPHLIQHQSYVSSSEVI